MKIIIDKGRDTNFMTASLEKNQAKNTDRGYYAGMVQTIET